VAGAGPSRRVLAAEAALLGLFVLALTSWFAAWPPGLPPGLPFGALVLGLAWRVVRSGWRPRPPALETVTCLVLAVAYRFPALLHPWGWVNRDGAYGAFAALHMLDGVRPAPVFTEGANYQGTLKSHVAALLGLVGGAGDPSLLMTASSLALFLACVWATMALARRAGGPAAALAAGLYLAIGPRFLTVFSLNCVGQYVDVLALGGLALAAIAPLLDRGLAGAEARIHYTVAGLLLGAAFWQQPVALAYAGAVIAALALRKTTWRDPWALLFPLGALAGVLPVLLWNAQNEWATGEILGREPEHLRAQVEAFPLLVRRAIFVSFPILAGVSPGHPWAEWPAVRTAAALLPLAALGAYLLLHRRALVPDLRSGPSSALLAPLLMAACVGLFWAVASGRVYWRPRYLLPVAAATAVHLGVVLGWVFGRSRAAAVAALGAVLALNAAGTLPRLRASAEVAEPYRRLVRSLEAKGIRTGYADFSLAAPVTMFTAERIVLSPALGPTDAYESPHHATRLAEQGPDAYVLLGDDESERFAAVLRALGISFRLDPDPFPVFYAFSRPPRLEEVVGFRGEVVPRPPPEE